MTRERFQRLVERALEELPARFRKLIENVAVVIEDAPPGQPGASTGAARDLLMGEFIGTARTEKSIWDVPAGPDRVVLYQKNIEAYARRAAAEDDRTLEDIIREEVRLTVLHELGHYFGLDESQLEDV